MCAQKVVNVKIPPRDFEELSNLVKTGKYASISDAVRTAIRRLIKEEKEVIFNDI